MIWGHGAAVIRMKPFVLLLSSPSGQLFAVRQRRGRRSAYDNGCSHENRGTKRRPLAHHMHISTAWPRRAPGTAPCDTRPKCTIQCIRVHGALNRVVRADTRGAQMLEGRTSNPTSTRSAAIQRPPLTLYPACSGRETGCAASGDRTCSACRTKLLSKEAQQGAKRRVARGAGGESADTPHCV